jgi:hypothetical protein
MVERWKTSGRTRPTRASPAVQPVMFIDGDISLRDADKLAKLYGIQ